MNPSVPTTDTIATMFGRLFECEFATLDGIAISCRTPAGMDYADDTVALSLWLENEIGERPADPADPAAHAIHVACYTTAPESQAVISGWSRHLRSLLLEGLGTPPVTSMMRNRGVPDISVHLVEPAALAAPALADTVARAQERAERDGMRHLLVVTSEGYVVVAGAPPYEAMAHWHNIEFAARLECLRLEEAVIVRGES